MIASLLLALSPTVAQGLTGCQVEDFDFAPLWTLNGVWSRGSSQVAQLLLPDISRNRVLGYSGEGRLRPSGLSSLESDIPSYYPVRLLQGSLGMVIQLTKARLAFQDGTVRNLKDVLVRRPANEPELPEVGHLGRLWQIVLADSDAVVFADVVYKVGKEEKEVWKSGFLRVPLQPGSGKDQVTAFLGDKVWPAEGEFHLRYELMHPYIATDESTAYILIMDEQPRIFVNEPDSGDLQPLEVAGLESLKLAAPPTLFFGEPFYETFRLTMDQVEISAMAVGLYAWEGSLYLLSREPQAGRTTWQLTRVDPEAGKAVGSTKIKTSANHLIVVPGPQQWAFVRKGPYTGYTQQEIYGALLVDATRIQGIGTTTASDLCREGQPSKQQFAEVRY